ncbi:DUF4326 domain-containing protein [Endozoicomonas gorgoniicola]|uniref:DUF4326 domain-containing protein n=1 Tax=Endozoicomonas gorgoniicola TaxID=1234144 RepID=A0ABT3MQG7_9GAMM|nr:DUF4326 domain-containing protein [Endozoicomonas gorgoniicola]MCW7551611.1 DUF4326 domain-containing protein [Endozoicomonas gorgoniicola]
MNHVLILYPELFKCFPKFERKVLRILSNLQSYSIVTICDHHGFIKKTNEEHLNNVDLIETHDWQSHSITHAIVFDDGEEFTEEVKVLNEEKIPLRKVKIAITRVVNIKQDKKYNGTNSTVDYEYIGRGSKWGNPHSMYEDGDDRDEVIRKFKYDFDFDKFPHLKKEEVYSLTGKRLGCFCKPASCHGDVLADYLNSWDDGK